MISSLGLSRSQLRESAFWRSVGSNGPQPRQLARELETAPTDGTRMFFAIGRCGGRQSQPLLDGFDRLFLWRMGCRYRGATGAVRGRRISGGWKGSDVSPITLGRISYFPCL